MAVAPALSVVRYQTPDEKFANYVNNLDDELLACKAGVHSLPKLLPGRALKDMEVRRRAGGIFQVTIFCRDCGLPATAVTERGGILGAGIRWEYDYSKVPGYLAPRGTGRGRKGEYKDELGRRNAATIVEAGKATAAAETAARRAAAAQRAAKTPKTTKTRGNSHGTNPRARAHSRQGEARLHHERQQRRGGVS